jgi:hypothetical protein
VAQVGTELMVNLNGHDPDGDPVDYTFKAMDLGDLAGRADITRSPSGSGVFRWTPVASDVGPHGFDFEVSDGIHAASVTIQIDVRSAIGSATAPVFRQPLGSGTTLNLKDATCVDVDIVVDDPDSPSVRITQVEPVIEGATLTVRDGHAASWHWCPSREQQAEPRYTLSLTADDGDNPRTTKNYLVVLQVNDGTNCPGAAPAIAHTAHDVSSIVDLAIDATITDDKGIKDAPLLYYAMTAPATPPDLPHMTQLTMRAGATAGAYSVTVPNPVAQMPAGTAQTVYYLFVARDNDDAVGTCNHTTTSQVYAMKVTSTGAANLPICEACTSDAQCGTGDECVRMGASGNSYCLQACGAGCPAGYTCSAMPVTSVDGAMALQCVPDSGSCEATTSTCEDDTWEVNDTLGDASDSPVLMPSAVDLISCPSTTNTTRANDDWFKLSVPSDQRVDLTLAGGAATDLDLHLYQANGSQITASTGLDSSELVSVCLGAGTYYAKVNGFGSGRNPYKLTYASHAESCAQACVDDTHENDDSPATARDTTFPTFSSSGNKVCKDDDDWYDVVLFTGDLLTVDLTFTQQTAAQDLDIHLYKGTTDLTPCDIDDPFSCSVDNGQGGVSNEHAEFFVASGCSAGCDYFVVVHGYNHSQNSYSINIEIE